MKHFLMILILLPATAFAGGNFLKPFIKTGAKTLKASADDIALVGSRSKLRAKQLFLVDGYRLSGKEHNLTSDLYHILSEDVVDDRFVRELIAEGANVNAVLDDSGHSILSISIIEGHKNATRILIEEGADVNLKNDRYGMTPLMTAAHIGDIETFKMLIDAGADVDAVSSFNRSVLSFAIRNEAKADVEPFRVLIEERHGKTHAARSSIRAELPLYDDFFQRGMMARESQSLKDDRIKHVYIEEHTPKRVDRQEHSPISVSRKINKQSIKDDASKELQLKLLLIEELEIRKAELKLKFDKMKREGYAEMSDSRMIAHRERMDDIDEKLVNAKIDFLNFKKEKLNATDKGVAQDVNDSTSKKSWNNFFQNSSDDPFEHAFENLSEKEAQTLKGRNDDFQFSAIPPKDPKDIEFEIAMEQGRRGIDNVTAKNNNKEEVPDSYSIFNYIVDYPGEKR